MMAEVEEKRSGRRGTGEYFAGAIEGKKRVELVVHCNAEQPRSLSSRWKREATPEFSRQEEKGIVELALQSCSAAQFNLLLIPAFVPSPSAASLFIPSLPVQAKGEKYSQGYIHCIPYGKVSFVTRLSPLHPGYVSTVCAPTLCSHPPNHTAITATDKSDENMVIYTVSVRFFHSLTHSTQPNSDTRSCVEGRCKSSVDGRRTERIEGGR
jgi:hypothetical protein